MKYSEHYQFRLPEREQERNDQADINDLTENWQRIDQIVDWVEEDLASHAFDTGNPHKTTAAQVGAYTIAQTDTKLDAVAQKAAEDSAHALGEAQKGQALANAAQQTADTAVEAITLHREDSSNPHDTTAAQVGAYTKEETDGLLDWKLTRGPAIEAEKVLITNALSEAESSSVTAKELRSLLGIQGNVQEELDYLTTSNPLLQFQSSISHELGVEAFPAQTSIDTTVLPLLAAANPSPALWHSVWVNLYTKNKKVVRALLYIYFDGSLKNKYTGWKYITHVDTTTQTANGSTFGTVHNSSDITWADGKGTVHHAEAADNAGKLGGQAPAYYAKQAQVDILDGKLSRYSGTFYWTDENTFWADINAMPVNSQALFLANNTITPILMSKSITSKGIIARVGTDSVDFLLMAGSADNGIWSVRLNPLTKARTSYNGIVGTSEGYAAAAAKLATIRNFSVTGGATAAAVGFNGEGNVALNVTGLDVSKANAGTLPIARGGTGNTTGKATDSDKLNGQPASYYAAASTVLSKTNTTAYTPSASYHPATKKYVDDEAAKKLGLTATAAAATKLAASRNFSITGGATAAAVGFNGEGNVALNVTGLDVSKANAGTLPIARGGTGNTTGKATDSDKLNGQAASYYAAASALTTKANTADVLTKTNTTAFNPSADYHPSTKKYVDDKVSITGGDLTGHVGNTTVHLTAAERTSWNTVTSKANSADVLTKTNTAAFTPSASYHPATKKYVDDEAAKKLGTTATAAAATKLAASRNFSITGGATAAAVGFNGGANVALNVTGLDVSKANAGTLPVARGGTGNTTGNAASATKLATSRNLSITGGATAAAVGFNGEANVALNVTGLDVSKANAGTLPVARGGTGNTTGKAADSDKLNGQAASYYATASSVAAKANSADVLTKTNTTAFTPGADYHPATKKYVDDKVSGIEVAKDPLVLAQGWHSGLYSDTGGGTNGYVKIATLKLSDTYLDVPIVFEISQRGGKFTKLYITYANANSTDPSVASFYYEIPGNPGGTFGYYLHKSATSTWDLYVRKIEAFDYIKPRLVSNPYVMRPHSLTITWATPFTLTTALPSGCITATDITGVSMAVLNSSANAASATKLQTARTINGVSFNGTSNITIADSTKIPLSGTSSISGNLVPNNNNGRNLGSSSNKWANVYATTFQGALNGNAKTATNSEGGVFYLGNSKVRMQGHNYTGVRGINFEPMENATYGIRFGLFNNDYYFMPYYDNINLGANGPGWKNIYSRNSVITTSDERKKENIAPLDADDAYALIMGVQPKTYKMKDGTSGRTHYGMIAQDVEALMEELKLESTDFAGFIKSKHTETEIVEKTNKETGETESQHIVHETDDFDYALRYEEFIAPLIATVQRQQKQIDALLAEVDTLKQK